MVKKRRENGEIVETQEPVTIESTTPQDDKLRTCLEEIQNYTGIVGYIMKNTASASIDMKDPGKIVEYAILSSTSFETTEEFSKLFEIGNFKNITVNGKDLKMLSLNIDENNVSIFMEKTVETEKIMKKLQFV